MKLDSEAQRKELLDLIGKVPAVFADENGNVMPMTLGVLSRGLPPNVLEVVQAIEAADIEETEEE